MMNVPGTSLQLQPSHFNQGLAPESPIAQSHPFVAVEAYVQILTLQPLKCNMLQMESQSMSNLLQGCSAVMDRALYRKRPSFFVFFFNRRLNGPDRLSTDFEFFLIQIVSFQFSFERKEAPSV